jgi:hypothetical protein
MREKRSRVSRARGGESCYEMTASSKDWSKMLWMHLVDADANVKQALIHNTVDGDLVAAVPTTPDR